MATVYYTRMKSPVGALLLAGTGTDLCRIEFAANHEIPPGWKRSDRSLAGVRRQLEEYFARKRRRFELEVVPGGTEFQRRVWDELRRVPYGATITYRELAARVGRPAAVRAVGAANGQNPIPIVIPCHRIVGSDGSLRGYGGGLDIKRFLLELEGAELTRTATPPADRPAPRATREGSSQRKRLKGGPAGPGKT